MPRLLTHTLTPTHIHTHTHTQTNIHTHQTNLQVRLEASLMMDLAMECAQWGYILRVLHKVSFSTVTLFICSNNEISKGELPKERRLRLQACTIEARLPGGKSSTMTRTQYFDTQEAVYTRNDDVYANTQVRLRTSCTRSRRP